MRRLGNGLLAALAAGTLLGVPAAAQIDFGARAIAAGKVAATDARPTLYNYAPAALSRWRIALAKVAAGVGRAKLVVVGDSTSAGAGAGGGAYGMDGAKAKAWPADLKGLIPGVPVRDEAAFGDAGAPVAGTAAITAYDPRLTIAGTSWSRAVDSLGGQMLTSSVGSDAIAFAPTTPVDTCDIWYVQQAGQGTFAVTDGSGTLATVNASGATGFVKATVTRVAGTSPVSVQRTGAGTLYLAGFDCWNAGAPAVSIVNLATYGTTAGTKAGTTSPWTHANALAAYAPDLTILNLGINDQRIGRTVAQYQADMQVLIAKAKTSGDVILVWHHPDTTLTAAQAAPWRAAALQLARANGVPMLDLSERFGGGSGALYFDGVHLTAVGYQDVARAIAAVLVP